MSRRGLNGHDRFVKRSRGGGGKSDCAGGSRQFYRIERVTGPPLSRPYRQIQELCARTSPSADDVRPLYFIIRHCVANPNKRTAKAICLWMETSLPTSYVFIWNDVAVPRYLTSSYEDSSRRLIFERNPAKESHACLNILERALRIERKRRRDVAQIVEKLIT